MAKRLLLPAQLPWHTMTWCLHSTESPLCSIGEATPSTRSWISASATGWTRPKEGRCQSTLDRRTCIFSSFLLPSPLRCHKVSSRTSVLALKMRHFLLLFLLSSAPPFTSKAPGYAYGVKLSGKKNCVICYFGDGAAQEGDAHAAMNFSATLGCPVIFFW